MKSPRVALLPWAIALALAFSLSAPAATLDELAKQLEADDFQKREEAGAQVAALADDDLAGVIRYLSTAKLGPEATARIPAILKQIFLRQCCHVGEPETGMRLRLYVSADGTAGVTAAHPVIEDLAKDSPAAKAGLQRGDVIVAWEGKPLEGADSVSRLRQMLRKAGAGAKVKLQVKRFGYESYARLKNGGKLQDPAEISLGPPLQKPSEELDDRSYAGWLDRMRGEHGLSAKYAVPE